MKIYYFVHVTGTDIGVSGVPRVVRSLARALVERSDVELVAVSWSRELQALVHAEQKLLDNLARNGGPELSESVEARRPIDPAPGDWLLVAEVPHLRSHYADYASIHLDEIIGGAVKCGLRIAIVFHDILPLTFGVGGKLGWPFDELSPEELRARDDNLERLSFARYAHATALVDLVLPVSRTSGESLQDWLVRHGHRADRLPPTAPVLLPEQVLGAERSDPSARRADGAPMEFVALGLINAQKNQLAVMSAFLNLIERRPDLDLRLNLIGIVDADVAAPASLLAKRANGRIVLYGRLSDGQVRDMVKRARATVFMSLAEGFGLPVAESLWRGKPCLCSNSGSIGEIARGGGCLPVDPRSIDAIASGLETLASDSARYEALCQEIGARRFKTWSGYADQIFNAISAVAAGRDPEIVEVAAPAATVASDIQSRADQRDEEREGLLLISAADLSVNEAFAACGRSRSLFYGGALRYDSARDATVDSDTLFFGPYVSLAAGRYAFRFDGELQGELLVSFTARGGAIRIAETVVSNFAQPVVFELAEPVDGFEIVGARTPRLRSLTLRCAFGERRASREEPEARASPRCAPDPEPNPEIERRAPSQPARIVPAASLRVHDAYISGSRNRLRDGGAIAFDLASHAGVNETTLFYGPYVRLDPGRYGIKFVGELQGTMSLRLTRNYGRDCLRELIVSDFDAPVVLDIAEPANNFEAVGARTEDTRKMRLESIEIVALAGGRSGRQTLADKARGSLIARVLRRA